MLGNLFVYIIRNPFVYVIRNMVAVRLQSHTD